MGDVVEYDAERWAKLRAKRQPIQPIEPANNLTLRQMSLFNAVIAALQAAENEPKVRDALVDALGYDPYPPDDPEPMRA